MKYLKKNNLEEDVIKEEIKQKIKESYEEGIDYYINVTNKKNETNKN